MNLNIYQMVTKIFKWIFFAAVLLTIPLSLYTICRLKSVDGHIQKVEDVLKREQGSIQRDSMVDLLRIKDIKEEVFINQLDKQIDSILTYVTILFGIFGLVGFTGFQFYIEEIRAEQKKLKQDALKSKNEIKDSIGNTFSLAGNLYQDKEEWAEAILKYVYAMDNYLEGRDPSDKERDKDFYIVIFGLLSKIETCMAELKKMAINPYVISKDDMSDLKRMLKNIILNIEDGNIEQRMTRIREDFMPILRVKEEA